MSRTMKRPSVLRTVETNYMEAAMQPALNRQKDIVMANTWGHLAPQPGTKYPCTMLFCQSETGDLICIRSDFGDLPGSPWLQDDINDFVCNNAKKPGQLYLFEGYYIKFRNGNCRFTGKTKKAYPRYKQED